jgi:hypothetical protein
LSAIGWQMLAISVRTSNTTRSMLRRIARSRRGAHRASAGQRSRTMKKCDSVPRERVIASRRKLRHNWDTRQWSRLEIVISDRFDQGSCAFVINFNRPHRHLRHRRLCTLVGPREIAASSTSLRTILPCIRSSPWRVPPAGRSRHRRFQTGIDLGPSRSRHQRDRDDDQRDKEQRSATRHAPRGTPV